MKWLSRLPVTEEIAGSNPVEPAKFGFSEELPPIGAVFSRPWRSQTQRFLGGRWEIVCGESRTFLFSKYRFNPSIWRNASFSATKSSLFAIFLREIANLSHSRIGSTHALAASVSLPTCSSGDFFSLISSACLARYTFWSMSWSR